MQKRINLVLLSVKMLLFGCIIDITEKTIADYATWKRGRLPFLLTASEKFLMNGKEEFARTEQLYLLLRSARLNALVGE